MIVAGFGFRGAATADSLRQALLRAAGASQVDRLAAPEDKVHALCLAELAGALGLQVVAVPPKELEAVATPTQSPRVRAARRTGSVAEAAALAAAGCGARLLARRHVSEDRMASCAIAVGREA